MGLPPEILIVDDDAEMRSYLELALTGRGHRIVTAACPSECIPESQPAIAFIDLVTNGESPLPLIARLARAKVPVMVMTGLSRESPVVLASLKAGGHQHLAKPFSLATVRALVDEFAR